MRRCFRKGRSVEQQRPHQNCASGQGDTGYRRLLTPVANPVIGQPAMEMRGGQDLQRPILICAVVNLEPHRYHLFEYVDGRVNMCDAFFDGPTGKAGHIQSSQNRDGYILMPANGPVFARSLVEQDRPRETRFAGEKLFRQFIYTIPPDQFTHARRGREDVPYVRAVALEYVEHGTDLLDHISRENILDDQKTVASELLMLFGIETHDRR
jgi:hypothetical protein